MSTSRIVAAAALAQAVREYGHLAATHRSARQAAAPARRSSTPASTVLPKPISQRCRPASSAVRPPRARRTPPRRSHDLRAIYSGTVGFDFDHIQVADERLWLHQCRRVAVTSPRRSKPATQRALLRRSDRGRELRALPAPDLSRPEALLDRRQRRPGADARRDASTRLPRAGTREVVIGMAHRGRLNVLTHVLGKPYAAIIAAFEGKKKPKAVGGDPPPCTTPSATTSPATSSTTSAPGSCAASTGMAVEVPMVLAPNPSHLEFVNPVVEGMVRASQDITDHPGDPGPRSQGQRRDRAPRRRGVPGTGRRRRDAQPLRTCRGYSTGGTIHIIVNNQVGFTTDPVDSRSTLYASDLAKGFEIPVVHVNADDPEACLAAARMAMAYRERVRQGLPDRSRRLPSLGPQRGRRAALHPAADVRADHQASDRARRSGPTGWSPTGVIAGGRADRARVARRWIAWPACAARSPTAQPRSRSTSTTPRAAPARGRNRRAGRPAARASTPRSTRCRTVSRSARSWRGSGSGAPRCSISPDGKIDWAHAETLAFAAIVADGIPIRLTGQDAERGTFSQRHLVLHDPANERDLRAAADAARRDRRRSRSTTARSPRMRRSGFEYGYSVHAPGRLVLWEAQFGDFANGAQIIIDQFIVAARAKWRQEPALVLLLPHGYEGQGPEHSSARLERYLAALGAGQHARRQLHDRRAVLPPAAAAGGAARRRSAAAGRDDAEEPAAQSAGGVDPGRARAAAPSGRCSTIHAAAGTPEQVTRARALQRQGRGRSRSQPAARRDAAASRSPASSNSRRSRTRRIRAVIERYPNLHEICLAAGRAAQHGRLDLHGAAAARAADASRGLDARYIGRPSEPARPRARSTCTCEEQARIVEAALRRRRRRSRRGEKTNGAQRRTARAKRRRSRTWPDQSAKNVGRMLERIITAIEQELTECRSKSGFHRSVSRWSTRWSVTG